MREIQSKEEKNIEETARTVAIPHPIPTFDHSCDFWWLSYKSQWHCELFLFKDQPLVNVFNGPTAPAPWVPWVLASHGCHAWSFCYMRVTQILESSCPQARGKHCWVIAGDVWVIVGGLRCTWDTSSSSFTIIHQFYCFWCFCCLDVFILDCPFVLVLRCNKARQTHGASWCHHRNTMPESFWEASWTLCRCHIRAHILRTTLVPFTSFYCIFMDVYDRILCRRPGASLLQFDGLKSSLDLFLWIESDIQPGAVLQGYRLQEFRLVLLQQKHAISNLLAAVLHHLPSTQHLGTTYPLSCEPCLWIRWLSTWSILHTIDYLYLFVCSSFTQR